MGVFLEVSAAAFFLGVVFSIMGNMLPSEKFAVQMRSIFALIFILVTVPQILKADISFDFEGINSYTYENAEEKTERILTEGISQNICDSLEEILIKENIYPSEISVNINNSADGSISIISARIVLAPQDSPNAEKTERIVSEALGIEDIAVTVDIG